MGLTFSVYSLFMWETTSPALEKHTLLGLSFNNLEVRTGKTAKDESFLCSECHTSQNLVATLKITLAKIDRSEKSFFPPHN